jgi:3-hydroxyacyl-CoA dehydrogenase/enoyl-CoA hydratase/3-hydroxybutyryl-CoA epimerase
MPEDITDRLILRILNTVVACLRKGVVSEKGYVDAGMIFSAGFPPFRGGPMVYIAEQNEAIIVERLNILFQRYGKRFLADAGWGN